MGNGTPLTIKENAMKINEQVKKEITLEAVDQGDRTVLFCISNEKEDRDGDIMIASGVDFTNYAKNPQFLGFHDRREFPLGVPKKWWVDYEQHKVYALVYFPTVDELSTDPNYASEKAKLVDFTYHCYKTGLLRAVSINFTVKEYTRNANSEYGNIITKWELLEFSAVTVPANADAVLVAAKSFGISDVDTEMFKPSTKAGKRISAQTRKAIEDMKGCMDEMKACQKKMIKIIEDLLAEPEEPEEPEDDSAGGKSATADQIDEIDISSISLPDGEVLIDLICD